MARKELVAVAEELKSWLPSESDGFRELFFRLLASLPGGEELEELGYEPFKPYLGWKEIELIANTFHVLDGPRDVEWLVKELLRED